MKEEEKETQEKSQPEQVENEKSEQEKNPETFSDQFNLSQLYVIKGLPGIYIQVSNPNKSGMVGFREFLGSTKSVTVNISRANCLGNYAIFLQDGKTISLYTAFNNLNTKTNIEIKDLTKNVKELMELTAPGYDPDKFKDYHMVKVLTYFLELRKKIEMISLMAEENKKQKKEVKEVANG